MAMTLRALIPAQDARRAGLSEARAEMAMWWGLARLGRILDPSSPPPRATIYAVPVPAPAVALQAAAMSRTTLLCSICTEVPEP